MYILFINSGGKYDIFFSTSFNNNNSNKKNSPTHGFNPTQPNSCELSWTYVMGWVRLNFFWPIMMSWVKKFPQFDPTWPIYTPTWAYVRQHNLPLCTVVAMLRPSGHLMARVGQWPCQGHTVGIAQFMLGGGHAKSIHYLNHTALCQLLVKLTGSTQQIFKDHCAINYVFNRQPISTTHLQTHHATKLAHYQACYFLVPTTKLQHTTNN